jgi:hypothetical protein
VPPNLDGDEASIGGSSMGGDDVGDIDDAATDRRRSSTMSEINAMGTAITAGAFRTKRKFTAGIFGLAEKTGASTNGINGISGIFDTEYCAGCCSHIHAEDGKLYPQVNRKYIQYIESVLVKALKDGRFNEGCNRAYRYWNTEVRNSVSKISREKGNKYAELPEWTMASIQRHILYHTNDPLIWNLRIALEFDTVGTELFMNHMLTESLSKDENEKPCFDIDLNVAMKAMAFKKEAARINMQTSRVFSGGVRTNTSVAKEFYNKPGRAVASAMYSGTFSASK